MAQKTQRGVIDPLFIIVLVLVLAVGGFIYWKTAQNKEVQTTAQPSASSEQTNENIVPEGVYRLPIVDYGLTIPDDWVVSDIEYFDQSDDGTNDSFNMEFSKGDWKVAVSVDMGGKGGGSDCNYDGQEPELEECSTGKTITAEAIIDGICFSEYDITETNGKSYRIANLNTILPGVETRDCKVQDLGDVTGWIYLADISLSETGYDENQPSNMEVTLKYGDEVYARIPIDKISDPLYAEGVEILKSLQEI